MIIVYIHGAGATHNSFNYIRSWLTEYEDVCVEYDIQDGFENNIERMSSKLSKFKDIFFVGHSMGGIYALHLANKHPKKVLGAVTLSTPYGGVEMADFAKYLFPYYQLIKDIGTRSRPVRQSDSMVVKHPWTQVVTTQGTSPWISQENDGVVTVSSQLHHDGMEFVRMPHTHHEVLLLQETVELIKDRIDLVKK